MICSRTYVMYSRTKILRSSESSDECNVPHLHTKNIPILKDSQFCAIVIDGMNTGGIYFPLAYVFLPVSDCSRLARVGVNSLDTGTAPIRFEAGIWGLSPNVLIVNPL